MENTGSSPIKETHVPHEMGLLMTEVNVLESTIGELEKRLDNILTSPEPPVEDTKDEKQLVTLATDIRRERRRVHNATNVLENIIARLQN